MQRKTKKRILIIIAVIAAIVLVCAGAVIIKAVLNNNSNKGQMYTYIDYNEGTTKAVNYYIDEEGHAYNYVGKEKVYVLISPDIIERNKAGELTVDLRDLIESKANSTQPSESVSN